MATVFTTVGAQQVTDFFDGTSSAPANYHVGWGTGTGTAAIGDTTLFTEDGDGRQTATESQPSANVNQLVATITSTGSKTITNAGVFDAATAGNLFIKGDFTGIPLAASDAIEFTFQLTWS